MPSKKDSKRALPNKAAPPPAKKPDADEDDEVSRASRRLDNITRAIKNGQGYIFPADEDDDPQFD